MIFQQLVNRNIISLSQFILLRGARQVLTLHGPQGARRGAALKELSVIQDGSVLISDGVVKCVGSTRRIENLKESRKAMEIDVHGFLVMPGFIDPGLTISSEQTDPQRRGTKKPREIYDENLELMRACLQHGTLTAEMKANGPHGFASVVPLLRQLTKIGDNPVAMVRTWKVTHVPQFQDEMDEFSATIDVIRRRKLAQFVEIAAEVLAPFGRALIPSLASSGIPLKIDCTQGTAGYLEEVLRSIETASVTCSTWIGETEARSAAALARIVMFSPGSDIAQTCGPGMRHVIDADGAIALTSGYDARSAPGYSMQIAIARAVGLGRLSIEEALAAATVNAAYALGQGHRTGTLEAGKQADIAVLNIPDYRELPRQFGINQVRMALRAGEVVFNRGRWKIGADEPVAHEPPDGGMRPEHLRRAGPQPG